jgi:peptidoglycan/LPS O-acetylase OafA/YrhL
VTLTSAPVSRPRGYRRDIDGLRGIAVLAVVVYHANARLLPGGFLGVDVFFVISGFLITGLVRAGIADGSFRISEFLDRRLRRIVPALLIVLTVTFLLGFGTMFADELTALGRNVWAGATFTVNLVLFHDGPRGNYFLREVASNPLLHLWSLGVEEQFYLFWPAALLGLSWVGTKWVRAGTLVILGVTLATFAALSSEHELAAFYLPSSRMWELLAGALLVRGGAGADSPEARWPSPPWRAAAALTGLVLLGVVFVYGPATPDDRVVSTVVAVIGSLGVIVGGGDSWPNQQILSRSALVLLGLISYPWYLWHWPLLTFLRFRLVRASALSLAAMVALSLALAAITYAYVERPLRRRPARSLRIPLLTMLLLVGIAGVGAQRGWVEMPATSDRGVLAAALVDWDFPGRALVTTEPGGLLVFSLGAKRPRRTVVFIGDSHMEQYWPRVEVLRQRLVDSGIRVVFLTQVGCPPLPSVERLDQPDLRCADFSRAAYAYARRPEVNSVAVGARWEGYLEPLVGEESPPLPLHYTLDSSRSALRLESPEGRQLARDFAKLLADLRAQGKDVAVIESNPFDWRFDPHGMLNPLTRRRRVVVPIPVETSARYLAPVKSFLQYAAGNGAAARMLDPTPELCPRKECDMLDSVGAPLYRDRDHIRARTARRLTIIDSVIWPAGR